MLIDAASRGDETALALLGAVPEAGREAYIRRVELIADAVHNQADELSKITPEDIARSRTVFRALKAATAKGEDPTPMLDRIASELEASERKAFDQAKEERENNTKR